MTEIKAVVFPDAESWLRENFWDMVTDTMCLVCIKVIDKEGFKVEYRDLEEPDDEPVIRDMNDHVVALQKLADQIGKTLFVGGIKSPTELLDPGNWDAEVVDAYRQLVLYDEVVYG